MGQPAARQGDVTGHGGTIAVGDPTVLINGMPAARQGDMHVCPMCNGPVWFPDENQDELLAGDDRVPRNKVHRTQPEGLQGVLERRSAIREVFVAEIDGELKVVR